MKYIETDDSNLAQCEYCGYVCDWDDVDHARDPYSDEIITCCAECNEGESFVNYPSKRVNNEFVAQADD